MHFVGGSSDGKGLLRRLKTLRARHQLASKIQELKARVQEASARRMRYRLDDCKSRSGNVAVDPRMTALYTESSRLVGIDGSKEEVINLLTKQVGILVLLFWFFLSRVLHYCDHSLPLN